MIKNLTALLSTLAFFTISGCSRSMHPSAANTLPECISKKIELFEKESCNKGPSVKEYIFQAKRVFVFSQGNCGNDMTSEVVDQNCVNLGYLGGIAGNISINGEDFSKALLVKTVWEKTAGED